MGYTLITGASAGLGTVFAERLAAEGRDLLLVARRRERLEALAERLHREHGVAVEIMPADLAAPDVPARIMTTVEERGWTLEGLVNNAGFGARGRFDALPLDRQLAMIQLNVNALTELTGRCTPELREADRPFIINVASLAAWQAGPNMAVYYATKAFVLSFSEALHEELAGDGIRVSALCPGATDTEFAEQAELTDSRMFRAGTQSADEVVRTSLRGLGRAIVIPGLRSRIMAFFTRLVPRRTSRRIAGWLQA